MLSNSKLSSQSDELFVSAAVQLCEVMAEVAFSEGKIWICLPLVPELETG